MAEATAAYKVIGTRPVRPDGADKVTGRAIYGADMRLTGMLHGKMLRSPHAHARIKSIDTSKAKALPGVRAVVTAHDMPKAEDRMANLGEMSVNVKHLSNNALGVRQGAVPRACRGRGGRHQRPHRRRGPGADRGGL